MNKLSTRKNGNLTNTAVTISTIMASGQKMDLRGSYNFAFLSKLSGIVGAGLF